MEPADAAPTDPRRPRRTVVAIAVAGIAAAGLLAGGVAFAATDPCAPGPPAGAESERDAGEGMPGMHRGFGMHPGRGHGPGMMAHGAPMGGIHGEFVGRDGSGGYRTYLTQAGTVTAVGSDSIAVKSEDGYSHTYAVTTSSVVDAGRDGIDDVEVGDTVRLMAARQGGEDRVLHLADLSRLKRGWLR